MTSTVLVILGLAAVILNLWVYRNFVKTLPQVNSLRRRLVTWAELIYPPMRNFSLSTRAFIRESYTSRTPDGFTLWAVVLTTVAAMICVIAGLAEYGFSKFTLAEFLGETPDTATMLFGFSLSSVLAVLILAISALMGFILFEKLGAKQPPNPINAETATPIEIATENDQRKKNYLWKLAAGNVLVIIAGFQAYLGFQRGNEFILASSYQEQILGNVATVNPSDNLAISLLNAFLGFLMPFITAFTARYLLTLFLWILASTLSVLLFLVLWLPTWALNGAIVRYQQQHGAPQIENAPNETGNSPSSAEAARNVTPQSPPPGNNFGGATGNVTDGAAPDERAEDESQRAANERIEEEREELNERREAERRQREQANSNPFGI
jgi:hypothetical protein